MRILVTGASGYIGSHVCKLIAETTDCYLEGWDIEHYGQSNDVNYWVNKYRKVDVTSDFKYQYFDAVVHLAGRSLVPESIKFPTDYYKTNIFGTHNMLMRIKTPHFLFAGTSSSFEMASPYAVSKAAAEDIIREHATGHTIFRFFNVSGTNGIHRQLNPPSHLIHMAARHAAGKEAHIKIFGTDYDTRDGTTIRDYIHVEDLASAIVKTIKWRALNTRYECLGSNVGYSVLEVLDAMERVTGKKLKRVNAPRRTGDAVVSIVDKLSDTVKLTKTLEDMCLDQYKFEISSNK